MKYDYEDAMETAILGWIDNNVEVITANVEDITDADEVRDFLYDTLFSDDDVTGNETGCYFDTISAETRVMENLVLAIQATTEFDCVDTLAKHIDNGDWNYLDVTIRCYLLGAVIDNAMDRILNQIDARVNGG